MVFLVKMCIETKVINRSFAEFKIGEEIMPKEYMHHVTYRSNLYIPGIDLN